MGLRKLGRFFPSTHIFFCLLSSFFMSICFCWPSTSGFALSLPLEGPPYCYRSHNKYHETDCTISLDLCIRHIDFFCPDHGVVLCQATFLSTITSLPKLPLETVLRTTILCNEDLLYLRHIHDFGELTLTGPFDC